MSLEKIKAYRRYRQIKKQSEDEIFAKKSFGTSYIFTPSLSSEILFSRDLLSEAKTIIGLPKRNLPFKRPVRRKAYFSRSIHPQSEKRASKYDFKPYVSKPYSEEVRLQNAVPSPLDNPGFSLS